MTMTLDHRPATRSTVKWQVPKAGVWVARREDRFIGLVEARWGSGFTATTRLGKQLGLFPTVDEAQAAVETATER